MQISKKRWISRWEEDEFMIWEAQNPDYKDTEELETWFVEK